MFLLLILLSSLGIVCTTVLPKRNISDIVKNEGGGAHWYQQPLQQPISPTYTETSPFSYQGYALPATQNTFKPCYSPASCSHTLPVGLDQFYCSAHGSFALGRGDAPNKLMREFCRFTAITNANSCSTCCKIAARDYSTSDNEVHGIIFAFDPKNPPTINLSTPFHTRQKRAPKSDTFTEIYSDKSTKKAQDPVLSTSENVPQCFCCAPMRSINSF